MKVLSASLIFYCVSLAAAPSNSVSLSRPIGFEPNLGQTAKPVRFIAHAGGQTIFITGDALVVAPHSGDPLSIRLASSNQNEPASGIDPLPGYSNYLLGNSPERWTRDVPRYSKIRFRDVYPGIDLVYYFSGENLEHDFVIAPGAQSGNIRLRVDGARRLRLDSAGDLLIETQSGTLRQKKPSIYQESAGGRTPIAGGYVIRGREFGFEIGPHDTSQPLVIDPQTLFSTYLGGSGSDAPYAIAVDAQGDAYVTGTTTSPNFPVKGAFQSANAGGNDVFITKIDGATGALVYSTYLGGSGDDYGYRVKVDSSGNAIVAGTTSSTNFPVVGGVQSSPGGSWDAFVTKLNAAGNALVYSTYLGGSGIDVAMGLDIDTQGNIYVAGTTDSTNFPTRLALQNASGGGVDGFLAKINPGGTQLVYSTYFGGNGTDSVRGLAVNSLGEAFLVGSTTSTDLPTTVDGSRWPTLAGEADGFMVRIAATGAAIEYISYYGGSLNDLCTSVAVDVNDPNTIYIVCLTESPDFPLANGGGTGLTAGNAEPIVAKFLLPSSSPDFRTPAARASVDDYDWSKVPLSIPPPPTALPWDDLIKLWLMNPFDPGWNNVIERKLTEEIQASLQGPSGATQSGPVSGDVKRRPGSNAVSQAATPSFPGSVLFSLNTADGSNAPFPALPAGASGATTAYNSIAEDSTGTTYLTAQTSDPTLPVSAFGMHAGASDATGYVIRLANASSTAPTISSVTNAFGNGPIAANTWVAVKGTGLAPAGDPRTWKSSDFVNNQLPAALDGVGVTVNGSPAYVYYISSTQLNILTGPNPLSAPVTVTVNNNGANASFTAQAANISPSFFVFDGAHVVATHLNGTDVGPTTLYPGLTTPAQPGEEVVIYANGFGPTSVPVLPGALTQSGILSPVPAVTIAGLPAQVIFAALVSPGLFQFNVYVPTSVSAGDLPVVASFEGQSTQSGTVLTVQ